MEPVEYCGSQDVYLESGDAILPVNYRPYALLYLVRFRYLPIEVSLGVYWVEKSSGRHTLSEDGRLSIVVSKWRPTVPIQENGTVIIDPEEEKKGYRKTDNWDSVPKLIWEVADNQLRRKKVFIHVSPMVPVSDVLQAIQACQGCRGGYEILAPDIPYGENK